MTTPLQDTSAQDSIDREEDLNALRIRVAELCGYAYDELGILYKDGMRTFGNSEEYTRQKCANYQRQGLGCELVTRRTTDTDYPRDLNACHEFEEMLDADQCAEYVRLLKRYHPTYCILDREQGDADEVNYQTFSLVHAAAEDRCRAFVKVMESRPTPGSLVSESRPSSTQVYIPA